ncbi:MAG TPA: hypothetical protein VE032_02920 [Actinomycetota bacterium]|nr:hypothetical protein [Actinomycetota bacterium]
MPRMTRHLLALGAVACLLVSCTTPERTLSTPSPTDPIVVPSPTDEPDPAVEVDPPRSAGRLPGTLLIRTDAGGMTVLRPDATRPVAVVDAAANGAQVQQATWSPDGRWIAWAELVVADGRAEARVVVSAPDGSGRRESLIPFAPFYLSWDPTSSRVAFLGGEQPFTLGIVERRGDPGAKPLAQGIPFYLSWGPTGDRMVTHVGSEGLDELALDGEVTDLGTTSLLQAPSWGPDGSIAFVRPAGGSGAELVALDEGSGRIRPLADLEGVAYLVVSPDGSQVAFHGRGPEEQDFFDRALPDVATDLGVRVAATDGSGEVVATREPAMAWSWSPDGRRLAVLEPIYGDAQIRFRWRIWSDQGSFATPPFTGSIAFLQEAAFFTQFAQSTTMWSPDSSAFAYPAEGDTGSMIWVQPASAGAQPFAVGAGSWVGWSPA